MWFIIVCTIAIHTVFATEKRPDKNIVLPPLLTDTYVDIFRPHEGNKPKLGTGKSSCWLRGGTCMHIRYCADLNFESTVSGCSSGFKVCCKNFRQLPPSVGLQRAYEDSDTEERLRNLY